MKPDMSEIRYFLGAGFHRLAYTGWGDPSSPVVLCVHGLSRNSRDFDELASSLADRFHVICPDLPGRGRSDWLPDPNQYQPMVYVQALSHLLTHIGRPVSWVGTSLGGICGMVVAAAANNPISRMVLNDIGPFVPRASIARIRDYLGTVSEFPDIGALEAYLREIHAPFGKLTDAQWASMAQNSSRPLADGRVALHYDPAITVPLRATEPRDTEMWEFWDRIDLPMLVLRGAQSDLLLPETLERMSGKASTHVVADTGHAPAMMDMPTIEVVRGFLEA